MGFLDIQGDHIVRFMGAFVEGVLPFVHNVDILVVAGGINLHV
jgi:hypothetical protein